MPKVMKISIDDYKYGKKRFVVSISVGEVEQLIDIAEKECVSPISMATKFVREGIRSRMGKNQLPGQQNLFEKKRGNKK